MNDDSHLPTFFDNMRIVFEAAVAFASSSPEAIVSAIDRDPESSLWWVRTFSDGRRSLREIDHFLAIGGDSINAAAARRAE
jgi:hypothetical protein